MPDPVTREETFLAAAAGESVTLPTPVTREELFLAKLAGQDVTTPTPITRKEMFLEAAAQGGGGGGVTVEPLLVNENCTKTAPAGKAYSPVTVDVQEPVLEFDDVNFFDDAVQEIAYHYTAAEFLALTEMPANPTHEGLSSLGWNWTLADAKEYVAANGKLNIGQSYNTSDGATRMYITVLHDNTEVVLRFYSDTGNQNTVTIDWGDGSPATPPGKAGYKQESHVYHAGSYVISCTSTAGWVLGWSYAKGYTSSLPGSGSGQFFCTRIEMGDFANTYSCAFTGFNRLRSITSGAVSSPFESVNCFSGCTSLSLLTFPSGARSLNGSMDYSGVIGLSLPKSATATNGFLRFSNRLVSVSLPPIENVVGLCFSNCYSLPQVILPPSVATVQGSSFESCINLKKLICKPTTPPTLANSNALRGTPNDLAIIVPYSADHSILDAYKTATNWSSYANRMVEEDAP